MASTRNLYTRTEVALHKTPEDIWIIIDGKVYNVTNWLKHHPGGNKVIEHYGGEDATLVFESFHTNKKLARAYMSKYHIGDIVEEERELSEINKDFLRMRKELFDKGYFNVNVTIFTVLFLQAVLFEVLSVAILWRFGTDWIPYLTALVCIIISQTQALWSQHHFGHFPFENWSLNSFLHNLTFGFYQGWSCSWWRYRHNQHHAKTNVGDKDPDLCDGIVLMGNVVAEKWGKNQWGKLPYHHQDKFEHIAAIYIMTLYFKLECAIYIIAKRKWEDLIWMSMFYIRWHLLFSTLLGGFWSSLIFFFLMRGFESYWFTLISQINHVPMEIVMEKNDDWPTMQLKGTCNTTSNWFWDWFSGYLNYQIEHHLFPSMPCHNFHKVQPYVMEFCEKHGLQYCVKPLWTAIRDITKSLEKSGRVWLSSWKMASTENDKSE